MMKSFSLLAIFLLMLLACFSCQPSANYQVDKYLSPEEQTIFLHKIARYIAPLPKRVSHEEKFDARFDPYYKQEMQSYRVQRYFIAEDGIHYFLVNRPAPSLYEKRTAIGGRLRFDSEGNIATYEELFHTWKMPEEELNQKGEVLFEEMVASNDLSKYFPGQSDGKWIEFPDENNYFDKVSMRWRISGQDTTIFTVR